MQQHKLDKIHRPIHIACICTKKIGEFQIEEQFVPNNYQALEHDSHKLNYELWTGGYNRDFGLLSFTNIVFF